MSVGLPGRLIQFIALVLILTAGLPACDRMTHSPEHIASYTFSQLTLNEPIGFALQHSEKPVLLVRVEGFETAFESRLISADGKELSRVRLPYLRVGPVFHVLEFHADAAPISVSVQADHLTKNSVIKVDVFALPAESERDQIRIQAYRQYGQAIQSSDDESRAVWLARVEKLRSAADGFEQVGATRESLWSEFLQAYFHYFPVGDFEAALAQARKTQKKARETGQSLVELMALELEGQILVERDENDTPGAAKRKQDLAQQVLQAAADLARAIGMQFELAWVINTRGIGYFYQDRYARAEQQYQDAMDIALDLEDEDLQKLIRGNLALVRERKGDLAGALGVLHVLNQQLQATGSRSELAHNWSELSRLYQRLFLFPQSIEAQGRALAIWRELESAEGIGRSMSSLAYSYRSMGNAGMALSVMLEAIRYMEDANYGRGLREGFRLAANIYRTGGQFDLMSAARDRQANYLTSVSHRSRFQYEQGLDILAQYPNEPAQADESFALSGRLGLEAGDTGLRIRSRLQRCALSGNPNEVECTEPDFHLALEQWLAGAPPSEKLEARFLFARFFARLDRQDDSLEILDQLIDEIRLYRTTLPGVLGAWYWESRAQIFRMYMGLNLDHRQGQQRDVQSLLALNRLLNTPGGSQEISPADVNAELAADSRIRALLAKLETADQGQGPEIWQAIDRELLSLNESQRSRGHSLEEDQLAELLDGMPPESALLAYFFSEEGAWAWVADSSGVRLSQLSGSRDAVVTLNRAREGMRTVGNVNRDKELHAVGELLLTPLGAPLPEVVYLLSVGELAGFPFEAVRHDDRYFGQDHEVINLLSLNGLRLLQQRTESGADKWNRILLAGDPAGESVELPRSAEEINNIAQLFEGREITVLTGENLGPDILLDSRYAEAELFHFASHGQLNFKYPELSRLILSGADGSGRGAYLTPLQIGRVSIKANLVVLSACETTGVNTFSFERNLGYVSGFLEAGAGAVVASLWPVSDAFAQDFMQDFYTSLIEGKDAPRALAAAKRRHITRDESGVPLEWSSFQIYLR